MIKQISILAATFCLLGPILLFVEKRLIDGAVSQAFPIALIAICYFAYSAVSIVLFHYLRKQNSRQLLGYYLGERIVRLSLGLVAIVLYALSARSGILLFAANLLIYHLASLLLMSTFQIKTEKAQK